VNTYEDYKRKTQAKQNRVHKSIQIAEFLVGMVILFLSLHLFMVHSKLLFHLNPDKLSKELIYNFDWSLFQKTLLPSTLSALAYAITTAIILTIFVRFRKVFLISIVAFAVLDGAGVMIYYYVAMPADLFMITGAVYYSLYTVGIVISLGYFRYLNYSKDEKIYAEIDYAIKEDDIIKLRETMQQLTKEDMQPESKMNKNSILDDKILYLRNEKGMSQPKIADELKISQSKVSRTLAKYK